MPQYEQQHSTRSCLFWPMGYSFWDHIRLAFLPWSWDGFAHSSVTHASHLSSRSTGVVGTPAYSSNFFLDSSSAGLEKDGTRSIQVIKPKLSSKEHIDLTMRFMWWLVDLHLIKEAWAPELSVNTTNLSLWCVLWKLPEPPQLLTLQAQRLLSVGLLFWFWKPTPVRPHWSNPNIARWNPKQGPLGLNTFRAQKRRLHRHAPNQWSSHPLVWANWTREVPTWAPKPSRTRLLSCGNLCWRGNSALSYSCGTSYRTTGLRQTAISHAIFPFYPGQRSARQNISYKG